MDKLKGGLETLSSMQLTSDMEGLDAQSKLLMRSKEVLAVILQDVVEEYKGYDRKEIIEFIEAETITDTKEVSAGRTNTQVHGDSAEFIQLNEKVTFFDLVFRARSPVLSAKGMRMNLHIDVESQKSYQPGYPIEKRGLYYLARLLSSQLSLITESADYNQLEKCYSIWICRDDIPEKARYTLSVYEIKNTKSTGNGTTAKENYDLMTLVVIKLGEKVYNGGEKDEKYELFRFLNTIMYPHKNDFMDTLSEYIDFSDNEELWKEGTRMTGLGQSVFEDGVEEGIEKGIEKGIQALILDNLEEQMPKEKIIAKLQKHFNLTQTLALKYYEGFSIESVSH